MAVTVISTPQKTLNGSSSNPNAALSQLPYVLESDHNPLPRGYKIEVQLFEVNDLVNPLGNLLFRYSVDNNNRAFINVSRVVSDFMEFNIVNSMQYVLDYREVYDGFTGSWGRVNAVQGVYAKKQTGKLGGANLWEHLLTRSVSGSLETLTQDVSGRTRFFLSPSVGDQTSLIPVGRLISMTNIKPYTDGIYPALFVGFDGTHTWFEVALSWIGDLVLNARAESLEAKLLTKFDEPMIWEGWTRNVSYLIDNEFGNRTGGVGALLRQQPADTNKQIVATDDTDLTTDLTPRVVMGKIKNSLLTYSYLAISVIEATASQEVSNKVFFKLMKPCRNPIMIEWLNSLGVLEQHLFSINQEVSTEATTGLSYRRPNNVDIEKVKGNKRRVFSDSVQSMILTAESLTSNQIAALAEIKTAVIVNAYLTPDGSRKVRVVCKKGLDTSFSSESDRQDYRLVIEFPDNYNFYDNGY